MPAAAGFSVIAKARFRLVVRVGIAAMMASGGCVAGGTSPGFIWARRVSSGARFDTQQALVEVVVLGTEESTFFHYAPLEREPSALVRLDSTAHSAWQQPNTIHRVIVTGAAAVALASLGPRLEGSPLSGAHRGRISELSGDASHRAETAQHGWIRKTRSTHIGLRFAIRTHDKRGFSMSGGAGVLDRSDVAVLPAKVPRTDGSKGSADEPVFSTFVVECNAQVRPDSRALDSFRKRLKECSTVAVATGDAATSVAAQPDVRTALLRDLLARPR